MLQIPACKQPSGRHGHWWQAMLHCEGIGEVWRGGVWFQKSLTIHLQVSPVVCWCDERLQGVVRGEELQLKRSRELYYNAFDGRLLTEGLAAETIPVDVGQSSEGATADWFHNQQIVSDSVCSSM